jgi:hypothetical protein
VTIDVHTHTALLTAVQKLSGHLDKWFELQTKPRRFIRAIDLLPEEKGLDDERLYWSNTVGWVSIELCDAFSADEKAKLNLPLNGEWVPVGWLRHHWVIREKVHVENDEDLDEMGKEIQELLRTIPTDNSPGDYSDRVLNGLDVILKKYGYGPKEEKRDG